MSIALLLACGLLLVGFAVLSRLRWLRRLFVPASVVGGAIGLGLLQTTSKEAWSVTAAEQFRLWPGWLIAVVFAGMLLERPATPLRESLRRTAAEGVVVWIIIVGQLALGLVVTALLLRPVFGVPIAFGQLLEVGWAGGFGSATAWGGLFDARSSFPGARDLAVFFAATGLIYGVVSGLVIANVAVRRGWVPPPAAVASIDRPITPQPIGSARTRPEQIDPLALQLLILAAAVAAGAGLQAICTSLASVAGVHAPAVAPLLSHVNDLPLFLFTLIGGLIVRELMHAAGVTNLIDPPTLARLLGVAMEFLVVSALAGMRLSAVLALGVPSLVLMIVGAIWCVFTLVWVSPRLLPKHWFELGVINYEMATATTAQGLMLLRIVDPELTSGAAEDYALAAPLSAPFIGGGIITLALPAVLSRVGAGWVVLCSAILLIALYPLGRRLTLK